MEERHGRGRGGSWRRGGGHDNDNAGGGEHRGRGRGGYHRGRGKRDHYRGRGRGGNAAAAAGFQHRNQNEENEQTQDCDERVEVFSRRKLESNWDRYLVSEREEPADDTPAVRGTDYHVLLESAGDSFTQFRFSEEKDWEMDSVASSQMTAVHLDLAALAQCLQALPLCQRLNLEAELVQVSTPVELPAAAVPPKQDPVSFTPPISATKGPDPSLRLSSAGIPPAATPPQAARAPASLSTADDADEELDRLLGLDKPGPDAPDAGPDATESQPAEAVDTGPQDVAPEEVTDGEPERAEPAPPTKPEPAKKEVTEEDLEDWLDSMIS